MLSWLLSAYSSFLSYVPIKSMKNPNRFISTIITNYQNAGYQIKHLKMDNQFNKLEIVEYLNSKKSHINSPRPMNTNLLVG